MLKLENIHNVTLAKDGQEAYDIVKSNMDKAIVYDLIFMDIQVRSDDITSLHHVPTGLLDAEYGWSTKHTSYSPVRIFRTNCCVNCIRGRKQYQGLHGFWDEHVPQVRSLYVFHTAQSSKLTRDSKPIRRPALKQVLEKFLTISEGT